jgi:hypothetical protein
MLLFPVPSQIHRIAGCYACLRTGHENISITHTPIHGQIEPRSQSIVAGASLTLMILAYLGGLGKSSKGHLENESASRLLVCQSDGEP